MGGDPRIKGGGIMQRLLSQMTGPGQGPSLSAPASGGIPIDGGLVTDGGGNGTGDELEQLLMQMQQQPGVM